MKTRVISYQHGDVELEAFLAVDENKGKKPTVLIIHDWSGRNEFANERAIQLAKLGYCGIAIDMYGKNKLGQTNAEKSALMQPLVNNRSLLRNRLLAALDMAKEQAEVDSEKLGAMGFCFGGLCALDFARTGAPLLGVISFHGFVTTPPEENPAKIHGKILVLQGYNDPMVSFEDAHSFSEEMTLKQVDWQLHLYGQTVHAFTNPLANDPSSGLVFNPVAQARAWQAMENFWREVLG